MASASSPAALETAKCDARDRAVLLGLHVPPRSGAGRGRLPEPSAAPSASPGLRPESGALRWRPGALGPLGWASAKAPLGRGRAERRRRKPSQRSPGSPRRVFGLARAGVSLSADRHPTVAAARGAPAPPHLWNANNSARAPHTRFNQAACCLHGCNGPRRAPRRVLLLPRAGRAVFVSRETLGAAATASSDRGARCDADVCAAAGLRAASPSGWLAPGERDGHGTERAEPINGQWPSRRRRCSRMFGARTGSGIHWGGLVSRETDKPERSAEDAPRAHQWPTAEAPPPVLATFGAQPASGISGRPLVSREAHQPETPAGGALRSLSTANGRAPEASVPAAVRRTSRLGHHQASARFT